MTRSKFAAIIFMIAVSVLLVRAATAAPYFRIKPLQTIQSGAFFKMDASQGAVSFGAITPIVIHDAADGYLLLPGVGWNLLNAGALIEKDSGRAALALGPSVNLDEPVKAVLRQAVNLLPGAKEPGTYSALRYILAADEPGAKSTALTVGPAWTVSAGAGTSWRTIEGRFQLQAGLSKRF